MQGGCADDEIGVMALFVAPPSPCVALMNVKLGGERGTNTRVGEIFAFVPVKQKKFPGNESCPTSRSCGSICAGITFSVLNRVREYSQIQRQSTMKYDIQRQNLAPGVLATNADRGSVSVGWLAGSCPLPCRSPTYVLNSQLERGPDGILNNPLN